MLSRTVMAATARRPAALVLSGCGVYDGAEVHESVAFIFALSQLGVPVHYFAPDRNQRDVVNHNAGAPASETRNCLVESARITRGDVLPISELPGKVEDYSAVFFPGGFGAAKNLSDFAVAGENYKVESDVEDVLKAFHAAKKPIGLSCIAPLLAAKAITGCQVTLGQESGDAWPNAGSVGAATGCGAVHVGANVNDVVVDKANKVLTTPAYMYGNATPADVFDGIAKLVKQTIALADAN